MDDLDPTDPRRKFARFQEENLKHNLAIVDAIKSIAERKGCTAGQLCLAWVGSRGDHIVPIPSSSRKERILENVEAGDIFFTPNELEEIDRVIDNFESRGGRYTGHDEYLWR